MERKTRFVATAGLACLLPAYFLYGSLATDSQPTIGELLHVPATNTSHRLYPGAVDPKSGQPLSPIEFSIDHLSPEGVAVRRQITYRNGTVEEISMQPDGKRPSSSMTFYKVQEGENVRRLRASRRYAADGVDVLFEDLRRLSGLRERSNVVGSDGLRTVIDYYEDGKTHLREQLIAPPVCCLPDPVVLKDIRWRNDATHSVSYSNTLDKDTRRRTIVDLDARGNTLRWLETDGEGSIQNSKLEVFDPETLVLRIKGEGDYSSNKLTLLRDDGTVERTEAYGSYLLAINYFDATGTRLLREDRWFHEEKDSVADDEKSHYWPYWILLKGADDKPTRRLYFQREKLNMDTYFDVTESGVTYNEKRLHYTDDGFLVKVEYVQKDAEDKDVVAKSIEHKVEEGIRPIVDPALLVLPSRKPFLGTFVPPSGRGE